MKKTNKTVYALMAFGPIILIILAIVPIFLVAAAVDEGRNTNLDRDSGLFLVFFIIAMMVVGGILSLVSMIMYIMHIAKNPRIPEDHRIAWILGMVLANGITNIIYFFVYIAKEEEYIPPQQNTSQWG
ncbi:MAG: hypothetical protein IPN95_19060 [Bacteroidetes bacterium]|jgi:ABC-type multidrug transport system fused ATPase/permease subunit|nr:hypothetical protein [Bacteroidota bacterium]MBL0015839.1 hypothetical protein [Bacteroidota bacterium]MBP6639036.1 hypothetical protein [Bacteroidia bacterium]